MEHRTEFENGAPGNSGDEVCHEKKLQLYRGHPRDPEGNRHEQVIPRQEIIQGKISGSRFIQWFRKDERREKWEPVIVRNSKR